MKTIELAKQLISKLESKFYQSAFKREFNHELLGTWAHQDLLSQIPPDQRGLEKVIENCGLFDQKALDHWLFILPNSHSVAAFYPLIIGLAAGLKIKLRRPANPQLKVLWLLLSEAQKLFPDQLEVWAPAFKLGHHQGLPPGLEALLAFGEDQTLPRLKAGLGEGFPIAYFGDSTSVNVLGASDLSIAELAPKLFRDAFSLAQRGCLSSRALFVSSESGLEAGTLAAELRDLSLNYFASGPSELDRLSQVGIDQDLVVWLNRQAQIPLRRSFNEALFPLILNPWEHLKGPELYSERPFVWPIFSCAETAEDIILKLRALGPKSLSHISLEAKGAKASAPYLYHSVGRLNSPRWDGTHQGRPLFSVQT